MKYVIKKGYSYVDTKGRGEVFTGGSTFEGKLDNRQKWKIGHIMSEPELEVTQKNAPQAEETEEVDEMDEGEETE
jgi:hypothetical protein